MVSHKKVALDLKKVELILRLEPLQTHRKLKAFLDLASFFVRMISHFVEIAAPLF